MAGNHRLFHDLRLPELLTEVKDLVFRKPGDLLEGAAGDLTHVNSPDSIKPYGFFKKPFPAYFRFFV